METEFLFLPLVPPPPRCMPPAECIELGSCRNSELAEMQTLFPLVSDSGGPGIDTLTKSDQQASNRATFGNI